MKGLFYLSKESENSFYDFHPYHYGPYSLVVDLDCKALANKTFIEIKGRSIEAKLGQEQRKRILDDVGSGNLYKLSNIANRVNNKDFDKLLDALYEEYPYFAINNQKKNKLYKKFDPRLDSAKQTAGIFTVGYEGVSVDQFFNNLIQNNITTLVDVRHNPRSMKYGFTESTLKKLCQDRRVEYVSVKNLGIPGKLRQELNTQADYDLLFSDFEKQHMPKVKNELSYLKKLLDQNKRLALMCFEKDTCCCHRTIVANHLFDYCEKKYDLIHIPTA
ncbi:DUF488 domain-containing protein [Candidatus Gracilibacteria bacterium]|nr:DUF488 domain-containing protein [Candidatus Gracilibacteria bacterium]MCF7819724.1 DUF488 domain-containing protein [Candidatus Gracilibacteria bacterium]